jgi:uncharacterized protein DUF6544
MAVWVGIIAAIAAALAVLAFLERRAHRRFVAEAMRERVSAGRQPAEVVTENDLRDLPEPLARFIRFSGAIGRPRISSVRLVHGGRFKPGIGRPWMRVRGEYFITTPRPSFSWWGRIGPMPGLSVVAVDSYAGGRGRMLVRALSAFRLVDDRSANVSQSAFGRCVAELTMAPTFFLDRRYVSAVQSGDNQVRCTVRDGVFQSDADLHVNRDGSLDRVVVMRLFDRGGGKATLERFTGKSSDWKDAGGRMLASRMDGFWNLAEGDLHYVSFEMEHAEYE